MKKLLPGAMMFVLLMLPSVVFATVTADDVVCVRCVGTTDIADNSVTSGKIMNETITNADISITAGIAANKIFGTAWTTLNDGSGTGLDADTIDGLNSSQFLRNDTAGTVSGNLTISSSNARILFRDTDQALPSGLWHLRQDGTSFFIERNTAAAGDFSSVESPFTIVEGGNVGIGTVSPNNRLAVVAGSDSWSGSFFGLDTGDQVRLGTYGGVATVGANNSTGSAWSNLALNPGGGNVGIGTISPDSALDIYGDAATVTIGSSTDTEHGIKVTPEGYTEKAYLYTTGGNSNHAGHLRLSNGGGDTTTADITLRNAAGTAVNYITNNGSSYLNGGNVGIGITAPTEKLDVVGNILATGTICGSAGCVGSSSSSGLTGSGTANYLAKWNGSTTALGNSTLYDNGTNVGIGTTSPAANLDVTQAGAGAVIKVNGNNGTYSLELGADLNAPYVGSYSNDALRLVTDNTERVRITSGGKLGIGTSSPDAFTTISNTSSDDTLLVNDSGDGDTTPFYISGGGRVGIGTTDNTDNKVHMTWDQGGGTTLYVENTATDATASVGVEGKVYSQGTSDGQPVGVRGDATYTSPVDGQYGVVGYNWATTQTSGSQGAGVFGGAVGVVGSEGNYTGEGHGIQGETFANDTNSAGGIFYSNNNSTGGKADAVRGITSSANANSYSFLGEGPTASTGTKSAIVDTVSQGPTELYVEESPEVWFSDYGEGQLVNGKAHITLDPLFAQTITVDDQHPMEVFVQPYDNMGSDQLYVQRQQNSFDVIESNNGQSNAKFSYRVMAKRKHYEGQRLRKTDVPIDQFMEPGLTTDQLIELNKKWGLDEAYEEVFLNHTPNLSPVTVVPPGVTKTQ